jgi:hypothetical protein
MASPEDGAGKVSDGKLVRIRYQICIFGHHGYANYDMVAD